MTRPQLRRRGRKMESLGTDHCLAASRRAECRASNTGGRVANSLAPAAKFARRRSRPASRLRCRHDLVHRLRALRDRGRRLRAVLERARPGRRVAARRGCRPFARPPAAPPSAMVRSCAARSRRSRGGRHDTSDRWRTARPPRNTARRIVAGPFRSKRLQRRARHRTGARHHLRDARRATRRHGQRPCRRSISRTEPLPHRRALPSHRCRERPSRRLLGTRRRDHEASPSRNRGRAPRRARRFVRLGRRRCRELRTGGLIAKLRSPSAASSRVPLPRPLR